ncbi:MAG: YwiC-like family protein [Planctomycetaceae bacterium]
MSTAHASVLPSPPASPQAYSSGAAPRPASPAAASKLRPKEHGAYAILAIPLLSGFAVTGLTWAGACIAIASVAGFIAHEPTLVALGHRGRRAQQSTPFATSRASMWLGTTVVAGSVAMWIGDTQLRWSLGLCLLIAVASFLVAAIGKHRTLGGQLWGVIGLSVPCVPVLLAGGLGLNAALHIWAVWLLGFSATTMAVRGVIAAQKRQPRTLHHLFVGSVLIAAMLAGLYAALPMIVASVCLLVCPPSAKFLKQVGWTLVAVTMGTALLVIVTHSSPFVV